MCAVFTMFFRKLLLGASATAASGLACVACVARLDEDEAARSAELVLPREYDPRAFERFWGGEFRCVALWRTFDIASTLTPFVARALWHYNVTNRDGNAWDEGIQTAWGIELREMLTRLGPTFIKAGQAMSIRPDLLPTAILIELQKLCESEI